MRLDVGQGRPLPEPAGEVFSCEDTPGSGSELGPRQSQKGGRARSRSSRWVASGWEPGSVEEAIATRAREVLDC